MDAIQVTARLTIREGKLEEFKELATQCMRSVRERDLGTLQYDWFFNDTHTECVVRETYKDSEAVLEHLANLGGTFEAILGVCDMTLEVYGSPSAELSKLPLAWLPRSTRRSRASDRTLRRAQRWPPNLLPADVALVFE